MVLSSLAANLSIFSNNWTEEWIIVIYWLIAEIESNNFIAKSVVVRIAPTNINWFIINSPVTNMTDNWLITFNKKIINVTLLVSLASITLLFLILNNSWLKESW